MSKLRPLHILAICGGVVALLVAGILLFFEIQFKAIRARYSARQVQILYSTDHEILAREVRAFADQRRTRSDMPLFLPVQVLRRGDPEIPACLAILKIPSIAILEDRAQLEFGGGLYHYGVVIYNEGVEGSGTKKLGEGVWFYSDDGRYPGPEGEIKQGPVR